MKLRTTGILMFSCIASVSLNSYSTTEHISSNDIFSKVSGIWGWEKAGLDCKSLPSRYEFGDGNITMTIISNRKQPMYDGTTRDIVNYKVISNDATSITLAMENETRLSKNGKLTLWKIALINNNKFYWQISGEPQTQWGPVVKCSN